MVKSVRVRKGRIPSYLIYGLLLVFFLVIPVITNSSSEEGRFARIYYDWLRMLPFLLVFLVNSFLLLPKILFKGSTRTYLAALFITAVVISGFFHIYGPSLFRNDPEISEQRMLRDPQYGREEMSPSQGIDKRTEIFIPSDMRPDRPVSLPDRSFFQFINSFLISLLIAGFNTSIAMTNKWLSEEQARREAEKEHIKSELAFLQNQINPHFFMNTLNNIHALIESDPGMAQDSILKLSSMMRYLLYESGRGVTTLKKEADFIRSYVNLMQIRYETSVSINLEIDEQLPDLNLPPLLFISYIENAFKHGVSYNQPSTVSFRLNHFNGKIRFIATNTIPQGQQYTPAVHSGGIGLENVRKRLDLIFRDSYSLNVEKTETGFSVMLVIPSCQLFHEFA